MRPPPPPFTETDAPAGVQAAEDASINDVVIAEADRRIHGPHPIEEHGVAFPLE